MASDSDDSNNDQLIRSALRAREAISESFLALPADYPPRKAVNVHDFHEMAQTQLFEYLSILEPVKDDFGGDIDPEEADPETLANSLWWEPLIQVRVPVDGRAKLNGDATMLADDVPDSQVLSAAAGEIAEEPIVLRLGNIRLLYQADNTIRINVFGWVPHQGEENRVVTVQRFLSKAAIQAVRSQLDRCLKEGGYWPEFAPDDDDKWTFKSYEEAQPGQKVI